MDMFDENIFVRRMNYHQMHPLFASKSELITKRIQIYYNSFQTSLDKVTKHDDKKYIVAVVAESVVIAVVVGTVFCCC